MIPRLSTRASSTNSRLRQRPRPSWKLHSLEKRIMLAGDAGAAMDSAPACEIGASVDQMNPAQQLPAQQLNRGQPSGVQIVVASPRELVFIDSRVPDLQVWLDNVSASAEMVLVTPDQDPIEVISSSVSTGSVSSIHFVSHGSKGQLLLGNQTIDQTLLERHQSSIHQWRENLTPDADLLIYGCDVASGFAGQQFLETLARFTGADVAASTNRTGNDRGMESVDWEFEKVIGHIETALAWNADVRQQIDGTLNIVINAWGQTGEEQFNLLVDGETVASFDAATTWTPFVYSTDAAIHGNQVRIEFTNDLYDPQNGFDRNLFVNNIQINGVNYETNSVDTFSTGSWTQSDGVQPGFARGIVLHTNGYFQYGADAEPQTRLTVRARGDQGGEEIRITENGETLATYSVSTEFSEYSVDVDRDVSVSDIRVEFTNDLYQADQGIDRNLVVDFLSINDSVFQSEAPSTFASGVFVGGSGIQSGFLQSEKLHTNGYFLYAREGNSETGVIDTNYGDNGLTEVGPLGVASAIDSDGNTLVLDQNSFRLINKSGNYVSRFGGDGIVDLVELFPSTTFQGSSTLQDFASTDDGSWIVSSAEVGDGGFLEPVPLIFKLDSSGNLDQSFGSGGVLVNHGLGINTKEVFTGPFRSAIFDSIEVDVDSNGRVLVAGGLEGSADRAVVRFTANGQIDSSFGSRGTAILSVSADGNFYQQGELAVQEDGSIFSVSSGGPAIWKLTDSGTGDARYGNNGVATYDATGSYFAIDGRGRVHDATNSQITRIDSSGNLDTNYGDNGVFRTTQEFQIGLEREGRFGSGSNRVLGFMVDEDGRAILAVEQRQQTGRTTFIRSGTMYLVINDQGELDNRFSDDGAAGIGLRTTSLSVYDSANGVISVGIDQASNQWLQYRLLV